MDKTKLKVASLILIALAIPLTVLLAQKVQTYINHAAGPTSATPDKPIVGIIRYDAWTPNQLQDNPPLIPRPGGIVQLSSDPQWHYRLPFFADPNNKTFAINEDSQATIDQEILYTSAAGINYWAFDWYDLWWQDSNPSWHYNYGLNYYLKSPYKDRVNFSIIIQCCGLIDRYPTDWPTKVVPKLVNFVKEPTYQKVLGGRPLIYFFNTSAMSGWFNCSIQDARYGTCDDKSYASSSAALKNLREQVQAAGLPNPYLVAMVWDPGNKMYTSPQGYGFDAISSYSGHGAAVKTLTEKTYQDLTNDNLIYREKAKAVGNKIIPPVNLGWDPRPSYTSIWYDQGTPQQVGANLQAAIDWNKANPTLAETNNVIIYAWNEFAEGGWLGPTIEDQGARLNAISDVLGGTHIPPPGTSDIDIANSYDSAWKEGSDGWVNNAISILKNAPNKTPGLVLNIGDSITGACWYADWPRNGQGKTSEDAATLNWMGINNWNLTNPRDPTVKNGFYLSSPTCDKSQFPDGVNNRSLTAEGGGNIVTLLDGTGRPQAPEEHMPLAQNKEEAVRDITDGKYEWNLNIHDSILAFSDAQFAIIMLGTNGPGAAINKQKLGEFIDELESKHIVPILSTIPPKTNYSLNQSVIEVNSKIKELAQEKNLPLIDFYNEIVRRHPDGSWKTTLISSDGIHPSLSVNGFTTKSNPYLPGGDASKGITGDSINNVGYLLRSWLTVQKIKEVKASVVDSLPTPTPTNIPTPTSMPTSAYFQFDNPPNKDAFIFKLTDPIKIQKARDILSGAEKDTVHVRGNIVKSPAQYNGPWSYYLNPDSISFFQTAVEACDASISYVEDNLSSVGGGLLPGNNWCPWGSHLIKEVNYPITTPTPTTTPSPKPTTVPTPIPTRIPSPTPTHIPTPTVSPTPLPGTSINVVVGIDGIGITSRIALGGNTDPKHKTRDLNISIYNATDNTKAYSATQQFSYDPGLKKFNALFSLPSDFSTGIYNVYISGDQYLTARYPSSVMITKNSQNALSSDKFGLITGDINRTAKSINKLNILDYNLLLACSIFSTSSTLCDSNPDYRLASDLNDDGLIDQDDFTLFLEEVGSQNGEILP